MGRLGWLNVRTPRGERGTRPIGVRVAPRPARPRMRHAPCGIAKIE